MYDGIDVGVVDAETVVRVADDSVLVVSVVVTLGVPMFVSVRGVLAVAVIVEDGVGVGEEMGVVVMAIALAC